ncbi:MAG: carboxypeptidase-like regulatory domain-containing protein [Acidobacteriota bacterium]|nr:carboxypeptidase-like regulatory domain-containing protein [Acidobacteriota bacterium]
MAILTSSGALDCLGQSQTEAKPAATPPATPAPKSAARETPAPTPSTGTIKGRVVSDDGRAVTNATIIAQAVTGPVSARPTTVDTEGRFVLDGLATAAYIVIATAPGYIDQTMSLGDPSHWPRHLVGSQIKITMIKGGVITGTVTNSKGEPVVGAPVSVSQISELAASMSNLMGLQNAGETDDRGVYRIYGLMPGQYIVAAGGGGVFAQFSANGFDLDVPTYYPSGTRDTAVPVSVRGGDETSDIDIKYRGTNGHSISGIATGAVGEGASAGSVTIFLSHAGTTSIQSLAIASAVDQRRVFSFNGVADGEYDLYAAFQTISNDNPLVGMKRITMRGSDVTGIELKLAPLAAIAGTITLDPIKPEDKCDQRASQLIEIVLSAPRDDEKKSGSQAMAPFLGGFGSSLNAKGEFNMRNLEAGKYRLGIGLPTEAWYVRAITPPAVVRVTQPAATPARSGDGWQGFVTLKSGERVSPVSIEVGQDAAGLSGHVAVTPETAIPAGLKVHLVPEERERVNNVLRYGETPVNRDGNFRFTNLAPGRYFVVARVEPVNETQSTAPRPLAWDPAARIKLRRDADAANKLIELKPCQRLVDYTVALKLD